MISLRARSASLHSAVTSTVNAVKRSGDPSSVPVTATLTLVIGRFARADRAKQMAGEAAAQRDELIFAAGRTQVESALGDTRSTSIECERTTARDVVWLTCSMVALNVCSCGKSSHVTRSRPAAPDDPDEQEHDCDDEKDVQPPAEHGGRNHPEQPQRDEQNDEKHQHRRSSRVPSVSSTSDARSSSAVTPYAATTRFRRTPIPSTSVSITSPTWSHSCGVRPMPTPSGVPVEMMSPGSSVQPQREHLDRLVDREDHVGGVAVLLLDTVDAKLDRFALRVAEFVGRDDDRPHRAEGVEALALEELHVRALQVARADVVDHGVAEDMRHRIAAADVACRRRR